MATIHKTTMSPTKLELLASWLPRQPWYVGPDSAELRRAGGFRLDDPAGEVGIEFFIVNAVSGDTSVTYLVPMTYRGAPLKGAESALIGVGEHGVLGRRWIYDGMADPVLIEELARLVRGEARAQHQSRSDEVDDRVVVRTARGGAAGGELHIVRVLAAGADESAVVIATWDAINGNPVTGPVVVLAA